MQKFMMTTTTTMMTNVNSADGDDDAEYLKCIYS